MNQLSLLANNDNLPDSLKENRMQADRLLFQEAQVNYMQRKKAQ